jgi:DNA-binding GntR family transcriptional regulator
MTEAPPFDPSKPFEVQGGDAPAFDPSKPFETIDAPDGINPETGRLRLTVRPAQPSLVEDAAKSAGSGVVRGVAKIAGTGGDITKALGSAIESLEKAGVKVDRDAMLASMPSWLKPYHEKPAKTIGSKEIMGAVDQATGLPVTSYEPQTKVGEYMRTVGEFAPGALMGPGSALRNLLAFGAVPGVASEAAGQATKGTAIEPWARGGAALVSGGASAVLSRPRSAQQAIRNVMPEGVTPAVVAEAERLMQDAAARGIALTWPEAIAQVAPGQGTGLLNTQRLLESSRQTSGDLAPMFAQRPAQIEQAARTEFGQVAPRPTAPSTIGPAVGQTADDALNTERQFINLATDADYAAASGVRLSPAEMARVRALPGYDEAAAAVRNDPQLNRYVANLPDDSVGFLNEVKKQLDQQAANARAPMSQNPNMQRAAGLETDAADVRNAATRASPDYAIALEEQSRLRQTYLEPLLQGPLGRLAGRDKTTQDAINALFPKSPLPGSEQEIATAVRALARRNPNGARDLVRAHIESVFDRSTRNLQGGANEWGGGSFAAALVGNPQEAANLQAAVRALGPNGDQIWTGFNRFLEIAQATGGRQRIGSRTAFNAEDLKALSEGRLVSEAGKVASGPGRALTVLSDAWGRWQLGRNLRELAGILTDPTSGRLLQEIARRPVGSRESLSIAARLGYNVTRDATQDGRKNRVPKPL